MCSPPGLGVGTRDCGWDGGVQEESLGRVDLRRAGFVGES